MTADEPLPGLAPETGALDPAFSRWLGICRDRGPDKPGCGAPILKAITAANGRGIPVDPRPVEGGNLHLTAGPAALVARVPNADERPSLRGRLYLSHFVTCPHAAAHRTPNRKK